MTIAVAKREFERLRLDRISRSICFERLGGRGSTRGLPKLAPVAPSTLREVTDGADASAAVF